MTTPNWADFIQHKRKSSKRGMKEDCWVSQSENRQTLYFHFRSDLIPWTKTSILRSADLHNFVFKAATDGDESGFSVRREKDKNGNERVPTVHVTFQEKLPVLSRVKCEIVKKGTNFIEVRLPSALLPSADVVKMRG